MSSWLPYNSYLSVINVFELPTSKQPILGVSEDINSFVAYLKKVISLYTKTTVTAIIPNLYYRWTANEGRNKLEETQLPASDSNLD